MMAGISYPFENSFSGQEAPVLARGKLTWRILDAETGAPIEEHEQENLVVTAGLNLIRACFDAGTGTAITHFGLGAGTNSSDAVTAAQTDLQGATKIRDALTAKVATTDATLVCQYYLTSATGNGNTFNEAGLFTASTGGTMYNRLVLGTPIIKTASVAVSFVWTLTWAGV
jgi:hypothetical protein